MSDQHDVNSGEWDYGIEEMIWFDLFLDVQNSSLGDLVTH